MDLLRLMRTQTMSKNDNNNNEFEKTITLTDFDTGVTLSIPDSNVTDHEYDDYITINSTDPTTIKYDDLIASGFVDSVDISTIYERPNDKQLRKRYTGHKKFYDVGDIGIHTLEKISKRDKK